MRVDLNYAMSFTNIEEFHSQCVQLLENGDISELSCQIEYPVGKGYSHHIVNVNGREFGNMLWEEYRPFILEIASTMTINQRHLVRTRDGIIEIHGTLPEKPVSEPIEIKNSNVHGQTLDMEIEQYAEELFNIFHEGDDSRSYDRLQDKSGFRAMARHLGFTSVDGYSHPSLVIERLVNTVNRSGEFKAATCHMNLVKSIAKLFKVTLKECNNIEDYNEWVLDLVEKEHKHVQNELKESSSKIHKLTCALMNSKYLQFDLNGNAIDESIKILEIYDTLIGHVERISKGDYLKHSSMGKNHAVLCYIDHLWNEVHTLQPVIHTRVPSSEVELGKYYFSEINNMYGQACGHHFQDGALVILNIYDIEDGDITDQYFSADISCLSVNEITKSLNTLN